MFHRLSTWWRALSVVLLSLATVTWPSAAQAAATPVFTLLHQDPVATLNAQGASHISLTLAIPPSADRASFQATIFPRIVQQSQINPVVTNVGPAEAPISSTKVLTLNCAKDQPTAFSLGIYTRHPGRLHSPCTTGAPQLRLPCRGAQCDGVYPLRLQVTSAGTVSNKWSLVAVQTTSVPQPLQVVLVETVGPSAIGESRQSIATLDSFARHPNSPVTLTGDYLALSAMQETGTPNTLLRAALGRALASPLHQIVSAPPASIDFGGLNARGLAAQVVEQLALSASLVKSVTGRYVAGPLLLGPHTTLPDLVALARAKVSDVILPEAALTYAPSTTLNWGAPFHVSGATSITALSTDDGISGLLSDASIEPGRRAAIVLGSLALLHFEAPNAPAVRTEVIDAPLESTSAPFVDSLLSGAAHDPFVQLASLPPSFSTSLIGTNGAPTTRTLSVTSHVGRWSSHNVDSLTALISQVTSYSQAVTSASVANSLRVALAKSEIVGTPDVRQAAINAASDLLTRQLSKFSVDASAITLAGPGTALPITLFSRANYTVTAVVHLITQSLSFPKGSDIVITMDSPTKSLRIPTANHRGSSLTLQVVVTTPDDQVVLARTAIQVRIAGTSIVGYLLSFASLIVLALWWWRTYRRKSKGRHAR